MNTCSNVHNDKISYWSQIFIYFLGNARIGKTSLVKSIVRGNVHWWCITLDSHQTRFQTWWLTVIVTYSELVDSPPLPLLLSSPTPTKKVKQVSTIKKTTQFGRIAQTFSNLIFSTAFQIQLFRHLVMTNIHK